MNELLFFSQIFLIAGFAFGSLKLGKEALVAWITVQALMANLFVLKQITLLGFDVTASDAYAIGSLLGLNFLQENFGREAAKKATWICFFFMTFFTLASQLHLFYIPSEYDTTQSSFLTVLSPTPRLLIASMGVFFIVQRVDILFFHFLKTSLSDSSFALRTMISLILSQFLDTVLFSFAGLYGMVFSIIDIIIVSFLVKLTIILFTTSTMKWAKL